MASHATNGFPFPVSGLILWRNQGHLSAGSPQSAHLIGEGTHTENGLALQSASFLSADKTKLEGIWDT